MWLETLRTKSGSARIDPGETWGEVRRYRRVARVEKGLRRGEVVSCLRAGPGAAFKWTKSLCGLSSLSLSQSGGPSLLSALTSYVTDNMIWVLTYSGQSVWGIMSV